MQWIGRIKKGLSDRLEEEKELEHIRKIVRQERLIYELEAIVAGSAEIIKEAIEQIIHAGVKKREMKKLIKYLNKEGEEKPIIAYYAGKVCNRSGIPLELGYYSAIGLKEYAEAKHTVKIPSSILLRETLE